MNNPTKRIKYTDFMKLTVEERKLQSDYFKKNKPNMVPLALSHKGDLPELPNCKFLLSKDHEMIGELNALRTHIIKNSQGKLNPQEALFFSYDRKLVSSNFKVKDFVEKTFKDSEKDGWVHIAYVKEDAFGSVV